MAVIDPVEYAAKSGTEHAQQVALFMWAAIEIHAGRLPELRLMFAIPNGGERNKIVAARMKAEGVKPGVPDVCLPIPRGGFHGLYIELKRPDSDAKTASGAKRRKGRVSAGQTDWIADLRAQGYGVASCVGFEQARETIIAYLSQ